MKRREFRASLKQLLLRVRSGYDTASRNFDEFLERNPIIYLLTAIICIGVVLRLGDSSETYGTNVNVKTIVIEETTAPTMTLVPATTTNTSIATSTDLTTTSETTPTTTTETSTSITTSTTTTVAPSPAETKSAELQAYIDRTTEKYGKYKKLFGIDISKYQRNSYKKNIRFADHFAIMRVSGNLGVDPYCDTFVEEAKRQEKLLGWYFYANRYTWSEEEPVAYARWCADQCTGYLGWGIFVLDAETSGNVIDVGWCEKWLNSFEQYTGITPFLYINEASERKNHWDDTNIPNRFPLWVARYGPNNGTTIKEPELRYWNTHLMQQYASLGSEGHLDQDVFYATVEDWWSYAQQKKQN